MDLSELLFSRTRASIACLHSLRQGRMFTRSVTEACMIKRSAQESTTMTN
jgi:hypothetical protein